ncbi:hypothetical protein ACFW16_27230 [Inquilinus sp. NPDC058860]|uniref:hypothetical protein n=1 Tax=Inquilinus sp. NPDC058860 TaxID=3346652 RepID=UPI0036B7A3F5
MTKCQDPQDWTILPSGQGGGSVSCGAYRGWYKKNSQGAIQITWTGGPDEGPPTDVQRAANEACARADDGRQASKSGRLDAGG